MKIKSGTSAPTLYLDLYAPEVLRDSRTALAAVREAGPAIFLPRHRMHAIGRFDDVRTALRDGGVFISAKGVAADPMTDVRAGDHPLERVEAGLPKPSENDTLQGVAALSAFFHAR